MEEEFVSFLCASSKMGYAKTKKEVMAIVQNVVLSKGRQVSISNGWWEAFIKRYPFLTLRTAEKLPYAHSIAGNTDVINNYFDLLEQTLVDNKLMDKPSHIFNYDETGLPLEHKLSSIVAVKHPRSIT